MRKAKETKLTGAWFARVYSLSSLRSRAEAIRLAGMIGVTTAEGFLRLNEMRRRHIVALAGMRAGTHPLKEVEIMLGAAVAGLRKALPNCAERDLVCDAESTISRYISLFGFDDSGLAPDWFTVAETGIALGLQPSAEGHSCGTGTCKCSAAHGQHT